MNQKLVETIQKSIVFDLNCEQCMKDFNNSFEVPKNKEHGDYSFNVNKFIGKVKKHHEN